MVFSTEKMYIKDFNFELFKPASIFINGRVLLDGWIFAGVLANALYNAWSPLYLVYDFSI